MFSFHLDQESIYTLAVLLPLLLQVGGLAFAVSLDDYLVRKQKCAFLLLLFLTFGLIAQNYVDMLLCRGGMNDPARTAAAIVGYVLRPIILVLLYYLVEPE